MYLDEHAQRVLIPAHDDATRIEALPNLTVLSFRGGTQ